MKKKSIPKETKDEWRDLFCGNGCGKVVGRASGEIIIDGSVIEVFNPNVLCHECNELPDEKVTEEIRRIRKEIGNQPGTLTFK